MRALKELMKRTKGTSGGKEQNKHSSRCGANGHMRTVCRHKEKSASVFHCRGVSYFYLFRAQFHCVMMIIIVTISQSDGVT